MTARYVRAAKSRLDELAVVPGLVEIITHSLEKVPRLGLAKAQWHEQLYLNFPLLYLGSLLIHQYAQRRGCSTLLFATRDCGHLHRVFQLLFPQYNSHYFHCSRNMCAVAGKPAAHPYDEYVEDLLLSTPGLDATASRSARVRAAIAQTVFVDIHGTGRAILTYFTRKWPDVPFVYILTAVAPHAGELYPICRKFMARGKLFVQAWGMHATPIEMLNYDLVGTLQNYAADGPVRDPPEYKMQLVQPYHDCIAECCSHIVPFTVELTDAFYAAVVRLLSIVGARIRRKPVIGAHTHLVSYHRRPKAAKSTKHAC
jgi:hypothetical protein